MNKRLITLAMSLLLLFSANATHLVSIDGHVKLIDTQTTNGQWRYQVELKLIRDCNASNVQFDNSIDLGLYGANSKTLLKIFTINKTKEQDYIFDTGFNLCHKEATYTGIFEISQPSQDLLITYKRCCLPSLANISDDQGTEFTIPILKNLPFNQATSILNRKLVILSAKDINLEINNSFDFPYADSVVLKTDSFYVGGTDSDPIPEFTPSYHPSSPGVFRINYQPGSPFGNLNPVNISGTDSINFTLNTVGQYLLPLTYSVYYKGKGLSFHKVFHVICVQANPNNISRLKLINQGQSHLELSAFQLGHNSIDSFILQKSTGQNAFSFSNYKIDLTKTDFQAIYDNNVVSGEYYQYRTKIVSQGNTYYSDTVSTRFMATSVQSLNASPIKLYPNPSKSILNIKAIAGLPYVIYDLSGKRMKAGTLASDNSQIDLSELSPGNYTIQIENRTFKLIHLK